MIVLGVGPTGLVRLMASEHRPRPVGAASRPATRPTAPGPR
jgi:hypothetical protein